MYLTAKKCVNSVGSCMKTTTVTDATFFLFLIVEPCSVCLETLYRLHRNGVRPLDRDFRKELLPKVEYCGLHATPTLF